MNADPRETLRRLTIGDEAMLSRLVGRAKGSEARRSHAITRVRLAALIATDAPTVSYRAVLSEAGSGQANLDELLEILIAVAEEAGSARVIAAAPRIAAAAGYDIESDLDAPTVPVDNRPAQRD